MNNSLPEKSFSAFPAVMLLALSLVILLAWNLFIVVNQYRVGTSISAQMDVQIEQAAQTEEKLKLIMGDLVDLAKTDTDAETIVKRYKIAFNPGAKPAKPATAP